MDYLFFFIRRRLSNVCNDIIKLMVLYFYPQILLKKKKKKQQQQLVCIQVQVRIFLFIDFSLINLNLVP